MSRQDDVWGVRKEGKWFIRSAYTPTMHQNHWIIGRADEGQRGYTAMPHHGLFDTRELAQKKADDLNAEIGISEKEANDIVLASMRR